MKVYDIGGSIHDHRIIAEARKLIDPVAIVKSARHKAKRIVLKLKEADFILICMHAPITKSKVPDLKSVKSSTEVVGKHLNKGDSSRSIISIPQYGPSDSMNPQAVQFVGLHWIRSWFKEYIIQCEMSRYFAYACILPACAFGLSPARIEGVGLHDLKRCRI